MSKATVISDAFGEDADLYEILGVQRDATGAQLRKAYYRKALTCHPDKVEGKEREFQALSVVYEVLKNPESRAEYDEHGELVDEDEAVLRVFTFKVLAVVQVVLLLRLRFLLSITINLKKIQITNLFILNIL